MILAPNHFIYLFQERLFLSNREPSRLPDDGTDTTAVILCGVIAGLAWKYEGDRSLIYQNLN